MYKTCQCWHYQPHSYILNSQTFASHNFSLEHFRSFLKLVSFECEISTIGEILHVNLFPAHSLTVLHNYWLFPSITLSDQHCATFICDSSFGKSIKFDQTLLNSTSKKFIGVKAFFGPIITKLSVRKRKSEFVLKQGLAMIQV